MVVSAPVAGSDFAREVRTIEAALAEHGALDRSGLNRTVRARYWGPGRFAGALRAAVATGRVRRVGRTRYALADGGPAEARFQRGERSTPEPGIRARQP
jgi:hypothetical protein